MNKKDLGLSLMKHVNQWLYLGKAELQRDFLFFFNLISEVVTFNTFVIRKCYYLKISTVFKTHIVLLYLCGDGLKNTQNLNDATMFNKSKAPD